MNGSLPEGRLDHSKMHEALEKIILGGSTYVNNLSDPKLVCQPCSGGPISCTPAKEIPHRPVGLVSLPGQPLETLA